MKKTFCTILFLSLVMSSWARESVNICDDWKFFRGNHPHGSMMYYDDSTWQSISIPHTWNTDIVNGVGYQQGRCWYRKYIDLPADMAGKRFFLRFEGSSVVSEVYVNGKEAGKHAGGYSAFCIEVTDLVFCGRRNTVSVMVSNEDSDNTVPIASKLTTRFGGIYRPVSLIVTEQNCISPIDFASPGVYLSPKNVTETLAEVEIKAVLSINKPSNLKLAVQIADASDNIVWQGNVDAKDTTILTASIDNPNLWNGKEDPYLYSVTVQLIDGDVVDEVCQPLGLRYFSVDADKGFFLNGKHLDLHGVNRHQEWDVVGNALTEENHITDFEFIKEIGATSLRLAHYQQSDTMYRLADESGVIVWAEIPVIPYYQRGNAEYIANSHQQLTELVLQNYNHPSICFWGMYNEVSIPLEDVIALHKLAKKLDPYRLTTAASNRNLAQRHKETDLICWNKYYGWYGGDTADLAKWANTIHSENPELKFGVSEYGAGGSISQQWQNSECPNPNNGLFYPEQYQSYYHEKSWAAIKDLDFLWGTYIWNMFDFSWPSVTRGDRSLLNHKGLVTYDRKTRKDSFYFYKANWSDEPVVHITSKRHTNRIFPQTEVKVYSNCAEVEMFFNGKSFGKKQTEGDCIFRWEDIKLKKGKNTVKVYAYNDGKKISDQCVWNMMKFNSLAVDVFADAAQSDMGNVAENVIDGLYDTYWATDKDNPALQFELKKAVSEIGIAWYKGYERTYPFEIATSEDKQNWQIVYMGASNPRNFPIEYYPVKTKARFVRINCHGNDKTSWTAINELDFGK